MENSFQTSFIPKKPIIENGATASKSGTNIPMIVSLFILVVICVAAGGLYFYKGYLLNNKDQLSSSLSKIKESFDKDTISELELYDKRSTVAQQVLQGHVVLSPLFQAINDYTLSSIQYTRFSHSIISDVFVIKMSGIARDYKSIALQADVFNTNKAAMFKDLVFSNLTKDKNNYVTFDLEFSVDPKTLSYEEHIANKNTTSDSPVNLGEVVIPATTTETQ